MRARLLFCLVLGLLLAACSVRAAGKPPACQAFPPQAREHLPVLVSLQREMWPHAPMPAFLAGQIEQESCLSLCHSKCWNTRAELKTAREYGFGLGQTTIAYKADGSVRFNTWLELRGRYPSLKEWTWENRFDARMQLTAILEMMRRGWNKYPFAATQRDRLGMTLAGYNGGDGSVLQDRVLCSNTPGCDRDRWFGNVERTSYKAKVPYKGYGKSPFEINREYPHLVLDTRRPKYERFFR